MLTCRTSVLAVLCLPLTLAGCGESEAARDPAIQPDPAIVAALAEPIMTDPDLAAMNRGNAAIVVGQFDGIPAWTRDPDQVAAARAQALRLAGGQLLSTPEADLKAAVPPVESAREFVAGVPAASRCLAALRPGFSWAADLPKAASLYPGAHVVDAAGARTASCAMRTVRYVTAAARRDVLDFHYTLLSSGGYRVKRTAGGDNDLLTARKGAAIARVRVGRGDDGMTEVALATAV
jgi:hypothetical protein